MNRMIPFPAPKASALLPYICLCIATSIADADAIVDNGGKKNSPNFINGPGNLPNNAPKNLPD